jgi:hypothetical protein
MLIGLELVLFLLAVGGAIVVYGTIVRNKWGINLHHVSCPRCKTALPILREPGSRRQALWGGWTCPTCGAGVDKWGREVTPIAPHPIARPEADLRRILRKRLIRWAAPISFVLILILDWTNVTDGGFPSTLGEAIFQVAEDVVWTAFFTIIFYFAIVRFSQRSSSEEIRTPKQQ